LDPHCLPTPPDPSPSAPGIYLGNGESDCWAEFTNDVDQDGLDDLCEYQLAYNFAPLMRSDMNDDISGETWWAVRPDGGRFHVFYALSYYNDWGLDPWPLSPCAVFTQLSLFLQYIGYPKQNYCDGHEGDSEFIVAEIDFDASTSHWVLERMYLSSHYGTGNSASDWYGAGDFSYPDRDRWYPRVFVARGKHANYTSKKKCEETVWKFPFWYQRDNCSYTNPREARVEVGLDRNLGSRAVPANDIPLGSQGNTGTCVTSAGRYAGNGLQECYWRSGIGFGGWQPYHRADGYSELLGDRGF
jgi:hypothetical protein